MIKFLFNVGGEGIREIGQEVREMKKTLVGLQKEKIYCGSNPAGEISNSARKILPWRNSKSGSRT